MGDLERTINDLAEDVARLSNIASNKKREAAQAEGEWKAAESLLLAAMSNNGIQKIRLEDRRLSIGSVRYETITFTDDTLAALAEKGWDIPMTEPIEPRVDRKGVEKILKGMSDLPGLGTNTVQYLRFYPDQKD